MYPTATRRIQNDPSLVSRSRSQFVLGVVTVIVVDPVRSVRVAMSTGLCVVVFVFECVVSWIADLIRGLKVRASARDRRSRAPADDEFLRSVTRLESDVVRLRNRRGVGRCDLMGINARQQEHNDR